MDLLNDNDVLEIISEIESSQNRDRREDEIKAFEVYSGDLKAHVENRIQELYPETHNSFTISDLNMSRKIINKLSKAYKQSPIRELETEQENEKYSEVMKDANANKAWQTFDIYYNLHRYACMWFSYYQDLMGDYRVILRPLNPSQFSRIVDKHGNTEVFVVNFPDNSLYQSHDTDGVNAKIQDSMQDSHNKKRYAIWTKDQHIVITRYKKDDTLSFQREHIEGNEESLNILGTIPAVFKQQGDNTALPIRNPLTNQTIEYNQQYSVMLTGASLQTFGHLILSYPDGQNPPSEFNNSLFTFSKLPQVDGETPTELEYLTPNPNLDGQLKMLQNYGHQIITEHLGDGAQKVEGSDNFTSGLDRMIAMSDITNIIESNQSVYSEAENELYLIIKAFYEATNDFKFKDDAITIKYPKAKPIQSEAEILANIEKKINLGLIERYEALIALDPNTKVEDAKEKIRRIQKEKVQQVKLFMGENGNTDQEESED